MLNKERLYWTLQLGGWAFYAMVQLLFSFIAANIQGLSNQRVLFLILEAFLCLLVTHGYRYFMNRWKWLSLGLQRLIPRVLIGIFCLGVITYFFRIPISLPLGLFVKSAFEPSKIINGVLFYGIIFFVWSVMYFVYNYFERYNTSLKLEASVKEIELNNLKSQLNPHFIFNALNSIRALVDENPAKSKQAINQLSNILRNSLSTGKRGLTSFADELKVVEDYLGLESIRFEERLRIKFEIDPESNQFLVPPLMIQTLVENGIKHGISKLTEGGTIELFAQVEQDYLRIKIRNSGRYNYKKQLKGSGLGIENTKQRLKLIYGDDATFRILNENNNFVLTELIIPHLY
jgi:two-component system LytT family sensor kinase